jgi:hypothetical protein
MPTPFRFDVYRYLKANTPAILAEAEKIGRGLGMPSELRGQIGVSGASSAAPGTLRSEIVQAIADGSRKVIPLADLGDEIRRVVKTVYGDAYDAAPTSSCEAALWVTYDALVTPPSTGRGEPYRVRCLGLLERHAEHHLSYGRPLPAHHKDLFADRGATAGELGILGRRLEHLDMVIVPMAGARYDVHGIKQYPCPLLVDVDPDCTAAKLSEVSQVHGDTLGAFVSLAYDTVGYGYGTHDPDGAPRLQRLIGELARRRNVPYIADNAWGIPFIGTDPRKIGADVMMYSIDKVAGGPTCGLIIGREGPMVSIRRALGVHGERSGTVSTHGKASHVAFDPGKEAMLGLLAALRMLRDRPDAITRPIDRLHDIVFAESRKHAKALGEGIAVTKSLNLGGVEINYQRTWTDTRPGIPIFSHEDRIAHSNLLNLCIAKMGVIPNITDDANIPVTPGLGTMSEDGVLVEERATWVASAIFRSLALINEWAQRAPAWT